MDGACGEAPPAVRRALPPQADDGGPAGDDSRDAMTLVDSLMSFTCKRFSRRVATGIQPQEGGLYGKAQFWIHWAICPFCRRYWKEMDAIARLQKSESALKSLPADRMTDVKARLKKNLTGGSS